MLQSLCICNIFCTHPAIHVQCAVLYATILHANCSPCLVIFIRSFLARVHLSRCQCRLHSHTRTPCAHTHCRNNCKLLAIYTPLTYPWRKDLSYRCGRFRRRRIQCWATSSHLHSIALQGYCRDQACPLHFHPYSIFPDSAFWLRNQVAS